MAKRKRLTPTTAKAAAEAAPQGATSGPIETKAHFPAYRDGFMGYAPRRAPPIAEIAGETAAAAALSEVTESLRRAREEGRMILSLPLDAIEAGYLVRDRIAVDEDEMAALAESLRARGQQTPIEVVALDEGRYGLISGWRRLRALRRLLDETGEERFGSVQAILRRPEQASDAYLAMVEENEIRVGLSFYERARIVAKAVELGVYDSHRTALRGLFRAASRPKRSKIGSFLGVVAALDGCLRFPEAIGERLGLKLAHALETDPALAGRLGTALAAHPPDSAAAEQALLARLIAPEKPLKRPRTASPERPGSITARPEATGPETATDEVEIRPGLRLVTGADGALILRGEKVDAALRARLVAWLTGGPA